MYYILTRLTKDLIISSNEETGRDRTTAEYRNWRKSVFERDNYTCRICGANGGTLNAHHIKPWVSCVELRFDVSNGVTLCEKCHRDLHRRMRNGTQL